MLERIPVQLEFLNTPIQRAHAPLPAAISRPVMGLEELVLLLEDPRRLAEGFNLQARVEQHLEPFFGALDGRAGERAASFVRARLAQLPKAAGARAALIPPRAASSGQVLQAAGAGLLGTAAVARLREAIAPRRRAKRLIPARIARTLEELAACDGSPRDGAARARRARHPLTGLPLESVLIEPAPA
jgi:hypothetical protein